MSAALFLQIAIFDQLPFVLFVSFVAIEFWKRVNGPTVFGVFLMAIGALIVAVLGGGK